MRKHFKLLFMFVVIFTTIISMYNCSKVEDKVNQAPAAPVDPSPADNKDAVSVATTITWSVCSDPENDLVKYDVYLGTSNPPALVSSNSMQNTFTPDTLLPLTKYYWKVVAKDDHTNTTSSAVWNFTTGGPILPPGNLNVIVCDPTQTNYFGGAEVFLYKSDAERTADPSRMYAFRIASTSNSDPVNVGALFYTLANQTYYYFARYDMGGGNILNGSGESDVPAGLTTTVKVIVQ